ncbi:MAG: hypothetical protein WEB00_03780 [Dehalococcoidia bacterium]
MPEDQVGAGVSILALREDIGYLAQVGPSLAIYGDGTRARRYSAPNGGLAAALGLAADFRPTISKFELGLGESVLLSGSALASRLQEEHGPALLGMDPEEALGQVYVLLKEQQNLGAILISHVAAGMQAPVAAPVSYDQPEPVYESEVVDETRYEPPPLEPPPRRPESPSRDPFAR